MARSRTKNLIPTQRVPLIDSSNHVTTEWYRFFNRFYTDADDAIDDVGGLMSAPGGMSTDAVQAIIDALAQATMVAPSDITTLQSVSILQKAVEALESAPLAATVDALAEQRTFLLKAIADAIASLTPVAGGDGIVVPGASIEDIAALRQMIEALESAPVAATVDAMAEQRTFLLKAIADAIASLTPVAGGDGIISLSASVEEVAAVRQMLDAIAMQPFGATQEDLAALRKTLLDAIAAIQPAVDTSNLGPVLVTPDAMAALQALVEGSSMAPMPASVDSVAILSLLTPFIRNLLTTPDGTTAGNFSIPAAGNGGTVTYFNAGGIGRSFLTLTTQTTNTMWYANSSGGISSIIAGPTGFSLLSAGSAQTARGVLGQGMAQYVRTGAAIPVVANTLTEVLMDGSVALGSINQPTPPTALTGGRVTAAASAPIPWITPTLYLTVDGLADLEVFWQLCSTGGTSNASATSCYPCYTHTVVSHTGVQFAIQSPGPTPFAANGNQAQLRLFVKTPVGAATVNITAAALTIEQVT